jgi:penicillin amidase
MRRLGAGRLAEVLGPRALPTDKWMRTLNLYRLAEEQYAGLAEPVRTALNLYAAGVNARIKHSRRFPWGRAALEFTLLGFEPEPWKPADSLVWGKIIASRLGGNWRDEILRARLARKLTAKQVGELWPLYPADAATTIEIEQAAALTGSMDLGRLAAVLPRPAGLPKGASNAWIVGNGNTATRGAILANDPHLGFSAPILWYLVRIEAPDLQVKGATVPGVPFTILGHNANIAWGMTINKSDTQDLFVERTDGDGGQYETPDGWKPFETRSEIIAVKDAKPVTLTVRESRHGPVISDLVPDFAKTAGRGAVLALSATYLEPEDRTTEAFYRLNRAENWRDFGDALENFQAPQANFFFADTKGDIGFMSPGLVPVRNRGFGWVPSPGWNGETDWTGYLSFDQIPVALNPSSGRIVNANNKITPKDYPHFISFDWAPAFRARRILKRLDDSRQSVHGTGKIQQDLVSEMAGRLLPLMLDVEPADELGREAVALLGKWNHKMSRNRSEPLIFSAWLMELNEALYADELGDLFRDYLAHRPLFVAFALTGRQVWCDNVNTGKTEDCHSLLRFSLKRAVDKLKASFGGDIRAWRWGDVHRARFVHRALTGVPWLGRFVDLEISTDGGNYTVNRGASHINHSERPFAHIHGSGYRAIYDLEDLRRSRFIISTGQSGNPFSSHYKDLLVDWRDGRYLRMSQDRSALAESADILVLAPIPGR